MSQKEMKYTIEDAFINRQDELNYLNQWINQKPNKILFIYGPKSSGKTTLLMKFIEMYLNDKKYNIKHFNLREILIANYTDFIQAFFEIDYTKEKEEIKKSTQYSLKVFKLSKEIKKKLENKILDPFVVMKEELLKIFKKGKRPVIIIDELQALEDIYLNGQRELLKALFNFFVAITKESHLCHVMITGSDGYFMKRIFDDSKLTKTSRFFLVDYLKQKDTTYWLNHLESESAITSFKLSSAQIEMIWKYLGGSMWEISDLLGEILMFAQNDSIPDNRLNEKIQEIIDGNYSKIKHTARLDKNKILLFKQIYKASISKDCFDFVDLKSLVHNKIYDNFTLSDELNRLVQMNYLAFNPTTSNYQLQGNSMFYGLKKFVERMPNDLFDNE